MKWQSFQLQLIYTQHASYDDFSHEIISPCEHKQLEACYGDNKMSLGSHDRTGVIQTVMFMLFGALEW